MTMSIVGELPGAPWAVSAGRRCRACGSIIEVRDGFGQSESVCPVCRGDEAVELTGRPLAVRAVAALGRGLRAGSRQFAGPHSGLKIGDCSRALTRRGLLRTPSRETVAAPIRALVGTPPRSGAHRG